MNNHLYLNNALNSSHKLNQIQIRDVWHILGLRETNGMPYVGYNWKNERKDGFLRLNSSCAGTELQQLRCDVFDDISREKMV